MVIASCTFLNFACFSSIILYFSEHLEKLDRLHSFIMCESDHKCEQRLISQAQKYHVTFSVPRTCLVVAKPLSQATFVKPVKSNIPGVSLDEPMDCHIMPQLKWWFCVEESKPRHLGNNAASSKVSLNWIIQGTIS